MPSSAGRCTHTQRRRDAPGPPHCWQADGAEPGLPLTGQYVTYEAPGHPRSAVQSYRHWQSAASAAMYRHHSRHSHCSVCMSVWSPVTGHRSLVTDHQSLVTGHWSPVTGHPRNAALRNVYRNVGEFLTMSPETICNRYFVCFGFRPVHAWLLSVAQIGKDDMIFLNRLHSVTKVYKKYQC